MKKITALLLALFFITNPSNADWMDDIEVPENAIKIEETFNASKVGKPLAKEKAETTLKLYTLVCVKYRLKDGQVTMLDKEGFIYAYDVRISQRINGKTYLSKDVVYALQEDADYVDGDKLPGMLIKRDGVYQFTAVSGAMRSVPRYKQVSINESGLEEISKEKFVELLKSGYVFEVTEHDFVKCNRCSGKGEVATTRGNTLGAKEPCPICKTITKVEYTDGSTSIRESAGTGEVWKRTKWKIKW